MAPLKHTTIVGLITTFSSWQIRPRTLLVQKLWPQTNCTTSKSEQHSLVSFITLRLVQTHLTHYYVQQRALFHLTVQQSLHHSVDLSYTLHIYITHCVHKPHPRVFPTTVRTSYTLAALIRARLSLALLYCTKGMAVVSAKSSLLTTKLPFVLYSTPKLHMCLEIRRCSYSLLILLFPFRNILPQRSFPLQ